MFQGVIGRFNVFSRYLMEIKVFPGIPIQCLHPCGGSELWSMCFNVLQGVSFIFPPGGGS